MSLKSDLYELYDRLARAERSGAMRLIEELREQIRELERKVF